LNVTILGDNKESKKTVDITRYTFNFDKTRLSLFLNFNENFSGASMEINSEDPFIFEIDKVKGSRFKFFPIRYYPISFYSTFADRYLGYLGTGMRYGVGFVTLSALISNVKGFLYFIKLL